MNKEKFNPEEVQVLDQETEKGKTNVLMLYNDDVNTFQHVIDCLIKYAKHQPEQAEQVAVTVHYNGKCDVKHGSYNELKPVCEALLENHLTAKIEE